MIESFVFFLITMAISIALAPRPKSPKAAAIEDFQFPTAEEGRPVPVVFGTVEISGPNVLWYGDLDIKSIKKRSGFKKATVGYKYYIGFHMGLCHGPADEISAIKWDEKEVWTGSVIGNGPISVDDSGLFGGSSRGGGVKGIFDVEFGGDAQTPNAYLTTAVGITQPAYRGIVCLVWNGGWVGNSEFVKPVSVRVKRVAAGWQGTVWNGTKISINNGMNGAHILYQCLTDSDWGMGVATTRIDETSFLEAADILYDEQFGMNIIWNQAASIEQFLQIILNHVGGGLTLKLDTGKYALTLFRGGYDAGSLPLLDETNVVDLTSFQKQGWGTTSNEVTLVYTDPVSLKDTSITAQDMGNIDAQGSRIPAVVELKGIRDHTIARSVLSRELAARTTPLTKITIVVNRRAWNLGFGGLFRFTWAEPACTERVFRVLSIDRGELQDNKIGIEALEDIYQYPMGSGLEIQDNGDVVTVPATPPDEDGGDSILSASTVDPPDYPDDGDTYYVPAGATGDWAGHEGQLAEWDAVGDTWVFYDIPDGSIGYVEDTQETIQVIDGLATPLFGAGSTSTVAGGYAVDKGYLWSVKCTTLSGGLWDRRLRGLGVVFDWRYIAGSDTPHAVFKIDANTGEILATVNTDGLIIDVFHRRGVRYYYAAGIEDDASPFAIVRKIDTLSDQAFDTVASFTDGGIDRFQSVVLLNGVVYAIGTDNFTGPASRIYKLDPDTLTELSAYWDYPSSSCPMKLLTDGTNLWYTGGVTFGRINLSTGVQEETFVPSYVATQLADAVVAYNEASSRYELWSAINTSGGLARLNAYRLTPGVGGHGAVTATYTQPSMAGSLSLGMLALDDDLLSWGRYDDTDLLVIALRDTNLPGSGGFVAALDPVNRAQYTARVEAFYEPAFIQQMDNLPEGASPLVRDKTWMTAYEEISGQPVRLLISDVSGGGSGGGGSRGATWVRSGSPISVPTNDVLLYVKEASIITAVSIVTSGGTGGCVINVWRADPTVDYPPGAGDSITGGSDPTIVGGDIFYDDTLSGWDTNVAAGDVILLRLSSSSVFTYINIVIHMEPT